MKKGMIPTALVGPVIQSYLDNYEVNTKLVKYKPGVANSWDREIRLPSKSWEFSFAIEVLSKRANVSTRTINRIKNSAQKTVSTSIVDKLLCAMDMPMQWQDPEWLKYYWDGQVPPNMMKPARCHNPDCHKWFFVKNNHQMYCSETCNKNAEAFIMCANPACLNLFQKNPRQKKKKYCQESCRTSVSWKNRYNKLSPEEKKELNRRTHKHRKANAKA